MIKIIVFDAYGTLISTGNGSINATKKILEYRKQQHIDAVEFYNSWKLIHKQHMEYMESFVSEETIFHMDLRKLYVEYKINGDADEDVRFMLNTLGNRVVFPEVNNVLNVLSKRFTICIGSTTDTKPLLKDINTNKISNIHHIYTSELIRSYKPQKEFYEYILRDLGVTSNQVLFVGDSLVDDILGPQQLGIKTCFINRKGTVYDKKIIPDYEIRCLNELIDCLKI